jgi:truncated hemoglobin YjbI
MTNRVLLTIALIAWAGCAGRAAAQEFVLDENQFDSWLLSSAGVNRNHGTSYREYIDEQAEIQLAKAEQATELTEQQVQKLKLAARGDTALLSEQIEQLRSELVGQSFPHNDINEPYQRIQQLGVQLRDNLYGHGSLVQKVLNQVLTDEQRAAVAEAEAARRARQHQASLKMMVHSLQQFVPMTSDQRDAFLQLMIDTTTPPRRPHQYQRYLLMYQLNQLPQDKLNEIFDQDQMKALAPALKQGQGYRAMLQQQGLLD